MAATDLKINSSGKNTENAISVIRFEFSKILTNTASRNFASSRPIAIGLRGNISLMYVLLIKSFFILSP